MTSVTLGPVGKLRLAAALLISDPPAGEINGLRRACSDGLLDRVDPHITLVEPINVREDDLDEAHRILRDAAAESGPLTFTLGPAASFAPDSPVLYLAVGGDLGGLAALRSAVRTRPARSRRRMAVRAPRDDRDGPVRRTARRRGRGVG